MWWRKRWWHFSIFDDLDQTRALRITRYHEPFLNELVEIIVEFNTTERGTIPTMTLCAALLQNGKCTVLDVFLSDSASCRNCKDRHC
jgi:hypothetical protein